MNEPTESPLPTCERCRLAAPCVLVETAYGERSICVPCFRMWGLLSIDLKNRVRQLLLEHHADFFDEPTKPDRPPIKP